jgi:2-polyprenyl-3-methyl-5-hydroxy-6-metoxy-1,4-benzoquinol methylase
MTAEIGTAEGASSRTAVFAAALLALALSACVGWRLLGRVNTDPFSERYAYGDALSISEGRHKFGIVTPENMHYPNASSYFLVPWIKLGVRDPAPLRRVPFAFGLVCEALLLAAVASMRVSAVRRLWLILAVGTIYVQPGVAGWLGGLHAQSYELACAFALLGAAAGLRSRARSALLCLSFLTGWMGYDCLVAEFCGTLAIRWLVHCGDASEESLAGPIIQTTLDGIAVGGAMGLAIFGHLLQNAAYFGSFAAAFKNLAASAASRMSLKIGERLDPAYYQWVASSPQNAGNPPRLSILRTHLDSFFFAGWWAYPSQMALLACGSLGAAIGARRISLDPRRVVVAAVFLALVAAGACGWIFLMPWHATIHIHFLPRTFFIPIAALVLASVMLPDAASRTGFVAASGPGSSDRRLENEIRHGKFLAAAGAGEIWAWETPAGKMRWARRVGLLTAGLDSSMKVLELGCGTGYFTRALAGTGAQVTAIDISEDLLAEARRTSPGSGADFRRENAYETTFADAAFDAVIGSSVLHHLDVERALAETFRVLKPGGRVAFSEPNMLNPHIALLKNIPWLKAKLGDSPDETAFFKWSLRRALRRHGFVDVEVEPYDFLHPALPGAVAARAAGFCAALERVPLVREIAGSLWIRARRPG